jgi:hypothetical protein
MIIAGLSTACFLMVVYTIVWHCTTAVASNGRTISVTEAEFVDSRAEPTLMDTPANVTDKVVIEP